MSQVNKNPWLHQPSVGLQDELSLWKKALKFHNEIGQWIGKQAYVFAIFLWILIDRYVYKYVNSYYQLYIKHLSQLMSLLWMPSCFLVIVSIRGNSTTLIKVIALSKKKSY